MEMSDEFHTPAAITPEDDRPIPMGPSTCLDVVAKRRNPFLGGKLTTHVYLAPTLRRPGAIPPPVPYVLIAWCLIK
jgi:hypothetical protein